ncbi:DegV family protein [Clostridium sp. 19966]|uniref:DegV family protein n=1 Tax=Clostridium sp. 19966 TaxID=2768166 RepID=UPI0028DE1277|nr:DegV family protein [Clostridium sp. 19966]MDT8717901.1 DegV family protein [Clostridium sp. 19966]
MEKIKIISDSTCDLPQYILDRYDIETLPLYVNFGEKRFLDREEINLDQLIEKIESGEEFPTTSQVIPQRFYECFKKYLEQGYKIISIHLSSKMSGTYQSACVAKSMLESEDILVIDSCNVTAGLGLLVLKAARLKEEGKTLEEINEEVIKCIPHVKSTLAFETLDYLVKGGRLSKTAGMIGNLLGIKLILEVKDGQMSVMDKVRGSKKAAKTIIEYIDTLHIKEDEPCFLLHVHNKDILGTLREELNSRGQEYIEGEVGCTVGVHAGPLACGIFFIEKF